MIANLIITRWWYRVARKELRGTHHVIFAMENMGIMDYMANGIKMEQNIVLLASLQVINSNSRS